MRILQKYYSFKSLLKGLRYERSEYLRVLPWKHFNTLNKLFFSVFPYYPWQTTLALKNVPGMNFHIPN